MQGQSVKLHRPVKYYTECYAYITYRFGRLTEGVRYGIILNEMSESSKKFYKEEFPHEESQKGSCTGTGVC